MTAASWRLCLSVLWLTMSAAGASAESIIAPSPIVVFGDDAKDWKKEVELFADLVPPEKKPLIFAGEESLAIPDNAKLVWFGDLEHSRDETGWLPPALEAEVNRMGEQVIYSSSEVSEGVVKLGVNCFVYDSDAGPGRPEIAVNFSGNDPQLFCIGLTIAHLLADHSQ